MGDCKDCERLLALIKRADLWLRTALEAHREDDVGSHIWDARAELREAMSVLEPCEDHEHSWNLADGDVLVCGKCGAESSSYIQTCELCEDTGKETIEFAGGRSSRNCPNGCKPKETACDLCKNDPGWITTVTGAGGGRMACQTNRVPCPNGCKITTATGGE